MASSHCNSSTSTPVLLLGTPFNTILCFSDCLAYLPNVLWHLRQIYQRGHLSPRSPSSTIQPGWTVLFVSGLSIILVDNNLNRKDVSTDLITNTITANRSTSSTCLWSKLSRTKEVDLTFFYFLLSFLFYFWFIFLYSIFRTRVRVRVTRSHCHTAGHIRWHSHKSHDT